MPRHCLPRPELYPSAPGVTRTRGQRFRKPLLYPSELQGHVTKSLEPAPGPTPRPGTLKVTPFALATAVAANVPSVLQERAEPMAA